MKRFLAMLLVVCALLSLAACGSEPAVTASDTPDASSTPEADSGLDPNTPAWTTDTSPIELEWFVGASWYPYTWGDSLSTQNITEKTGVDIEILTPTGDVSEELNLMMISGTLPDLITLGSWETCFSTLYEQGYTWALNDLADQYDPYFYNVVDSSVVAWHTKSDGNLYCVPNDAYGAEQMAETGMTAAVQTFLVRKDLYEDMGSPDMSTPEGFLEALRLLKSDFSTYKGETITPFYAQGGSGYGLTDYLQNFLAVPYEDEDGNIYDRVTDPDYIEWLKVLRQAYEEGLIGIDYLVDSDDQVTEKSNNGRYFCMLREWSGMQEANGILANSENPDSYYIAIDGPANSDGDTLLWAAVGLLNIQRETAALKIEPPFQIDVLIGCCTTAFFLLPSCGRLLIIYNFFSSIMDFNAFNLTGQFHFGCGKTIFQFISFFRQDRFDIGACQISFAQIIHIVLKFGLELLQGIVTIRNSNLGWVRKCVTQSV